MPTRSFGRVRRLPAHVGADASPSVWPYVCSPEWSCCFWPSSSPRAPIRLRPRHSIEPHRHSQSKAAGRRRGYRLWGGQAEAHDARSRPSLKAHSKHPRRGPVRRGSASALSTSSPLAFTPCEPSEILSVLTAVPLTLPVTHRPNSAELRL